MKEKTNDFIEKAGTFPRFFMLWRKKKINFVKVAQNIREYIVNIVETNAEKDFSIDFLWGFE